MALAGDIARALSEIVGSEWIRTDDDSLVHFGADTCDMFRPAPAAIVFPSSTEEVQGIVRLANQHSLALVPSGGRTGLSGGATATNGEVIVSMQRMDRILESSITDRTVTCQAGVVTARLHQQAEDMGLYYPVDFASTGSSQVGGNVATNAGGTRVIRYGMTRHWVAGLEVVTGAGEVMRLGRGLVKDNSGYDLQQLFIGSEGTLGIITEATLRLTRAPQASQVVVLGLARLEDLLPALAEFQAAVVVNAFEFFTEETLGRVIARHGLQRPFDSNPAVYALVEFESANDDDEQNALEAFQSCCEQGWVLDGVISHSVRQAADLWRLRDDISATLAQWHPYKNDLSVNITQVPGFLDRVATVVSHSYPDFEVLWYGHIGDGNVHLNILKPDELSTEQFKAHCSAVSEKIFALVEELGGSISAEHGVGLLKRSHLHYTRSAEEITLMRTIKQAFDPNRIMNPGKIFD